MRRLRLSILICLCLIQSPVFALFERTAGLNFKEQKQLALSYSKTGDYCKALEIIDALIQQNPKNKELLKLGAKYSIEDKNWDKAIFYIEKLLKSDPNSEYLLKQCGSLYSLKNDFANAIKYYEKLVQKCPDIQNKEALADLYMANQDYYKAQDILEPLYNCYPNDDKIIEAYLNSLLAQQKTYDAYYVIRTHDLQQTKEGFLVLGDLAILNKKYDSAANNYFRALQLDPDSIGLKNKLAQAYRHLGYINASTKLYCKVLENDPNNFQARLGLGYIEIDKKNFKKARKIFCAILAEKPDSKAAKIGIIHSYMANGENLKALEAVKKLPKDADVKLIEAKIYYDLNMFSEAFKSLPTDQECERKLVPKDAGKKISENVPDEACLYNVSSILDDKIQKKTEIESETLVTTFPETDLYAVPGLPEHKYSKDLGSSRIVHASVSENAQALKYQIKRNEAIILTPSYSFLFQQLADDFDLDYHKFGIQMSKLVEGNKNVFMEYNVIIYTSGHVAKTTNRLNNVTNEFLGGVRARPTEKWEYSANLGVKAFEFGDGAMLITDSWLKHYFNDSFNLKLGYRRNNIEQSYLSAVGETIDGIFTGRAADNKIYLEFEKRLPRGFYAFGRGSYGIIYAQNLPTNQYTEGVIGAGKILYSNPKNKWIKTFGADVTSYNSSYQYNLLNLHNSAGLLFGGYFSPSYFNANTLNLKLEGDIEKWHLRYGIKSFGGIQTSMSPDSTTPAWGVAPYIAYDLNDNITINASYSFYNYASVQRNLFIINAVIRGFKKHTKS